MEKSDADHEVRLSWFRPRPEAADQMALSELADKGNYSVAQLKAAVDQKVGDKKAKPAAASLPVFDGGGQNFTFSKKGEHLTIVTDTKTMGMDWLDLFMQNLRCAYIDYLAAQSKPM